MTSGTCCDDTPFYIDGEEVLCMRCEHRGDYQVVRDELHHKDVFWAECNMLEKIVGLPLNKCDKFAPSSKKTVIVDVDSVLKSFEQIEKMCANVLEFEDYPHGCVNCHFYYICRDFLEDMTLAELMSEYSFVAVSLTRRVQND